MNEKLCIGDRIVDELHRRKGLVKEELRQRYKGVRPFRMKPITRKQALTMYENITPEQTQQIAGQFGQDAVVQWVEQMEELRSKYYGER